MQIHRLPLSLCAKSNHLSVIGVKWFFWAIEMLGKMCDSIFQNTKSHVEIFQLRFHFVHTGGEL